MRSVLATVLEVAGLAAASVGAFVFNTAVGFVVAGAALWLVGYQLED